MKVIAVMEVRQVAIMDTDMVMEVIKVVKMTVTVVMMMQIKVKRAREKRREGRMIKLEVQRVNKNANNNETILRTIKFLNK